MGLALSQVVNFKFLSTFLACGLIAFGSSAQTDETLILGSPSNFFTGELGRKLGPTTDLYELPFNLIKEPSKDEQRTIQDIIQSLTPVELELKSPEGGWTGNGGDGFACFESPELAQKALDENGVLIHSYRPHIKLVFPRDLPETPIGWPALKQNESVISYLDRIITESDLHKTPYLETQILTILRSILNDDGSLRWNPSKGLKPIADQGRYVRGDNLIWEKHNCRVVQLVHRYQKLNPDGTVGLFFAADYQLLRRMLDPLPVKGIMLPSVGSGERAIAVLILHEIAYAVSSLAGAKDSESARNFIAHYFARLPDGSSFSKFSLLANLFQFDNFYLSLNVSSNRISFPSSTETWLKIRRQIFVKTEIVRERYRNQFPGIRVEFLLKDEDLKKFHQAVYTSLSPEERWFFIAEHWYKNGLLMFSPDLLLLERNHEKLQRMKATICGVHKKNKLADASVLALCN